MHGTLDSIKKIAAEGPCVIVGRCADYALENVPGVVNVFLYADLPSRIVRPIVPITVPSTVTDAWDTLCMTNFID